MKSVVILGMHRSGTSLVASMLHEMGVDMGVDEGDLKPTPTQPRGHWEDWDFVRMSDSILADEGGRWDSPPPGMNGQKFRPEVAMLLHLKQQEDRIWGWKDPRTCLTIPAYHGYLQDPHYVVVTRNREDVARSLEWREGRGDNDRWLNLVDLYIDRRQWFLDNVDSPRLHIQYEDLVNPETAAQEAQRLAEFVGMPDKAGQAASRIQLRNVTVDWRTAKGAWLTDAERQWLFNMSAETAEQFEEPVIVHIGVQYGGSLHCSEAGAPGARLIGVDIDTSLYHGSADLLQGDSTEVCRSVHGPVHFLFVDGSHSYEGVHGDILGWAPKVRPGGIIAFHDYHAAQENMPHTEGVRRAVNEWDWTPTTWEFLGAVDSIVAWRRKPFLQAGDGFGTIAYGVPYFKADYNFWRSWTWLLAGGVEDGDQLLNDMSVAAPLPIPLVHNRLIARFLETDRDTLCIVEDDHVFEQDTVRRMRFKEENMPFDIVCANYVNRRAKPALTGYGLGHKGHTGEIECKLMFDDAWKTGTQEVDGAAFGLVLIRRWVLDAMLGGRNPEEYFWCQWYGRNSQDITFYWGAREVGARVAVDRDANIGHTSSIVRTPDDFWKWREEGAEYK